MKLFKNYKSKKKLRREMEWLNRLANKPPIVIERNTIKISAAFSTNKRDIPMEYVKECIAKEIAKELKKYIKYQTTENFMEDTILIRGTIRVENPGEVEYAEGN
jgi:hypothetical protein